MEPGGEDAEDVGLSLWIAFVLGRNYENLTKLPVKICKPSGSTDNRTYLLVSGMVAMWRIRIHFRENQLYFIMFNLFKPLAAQLRWGTRASKLTRGGHAGMRAAVVLAFAVSGVCEDPPPPQPSKVSAVGGTVTNPVTGGSTTVTGLISDPAGTDTAGTTAFVRTADGYVFLVKDAGEKVYNSDDPPEVYEIVTKTPATGTTPATAEIRSSAGTTAPFEYQILYSTFQTQFYGEDTEGDITPPVLVSGASGVRQVQTGKGGSNGRSGALFVSPRSGGNGAIGPNVSYVNQIAISATNQIGIEAGSNGGKGGNGGNSYVSYHSGRSGGNGGAGGTVSVTNDIGIAVQTSGNEAHGIFAYSRSGRAGNGGSGYVSPGGGSGGHSNDGGNVTVTNHGIISTNGSAANGIYVLSVSNNGGNGGNSWGLVGKGGNGSYGGNGGHVTVTNSASGEIFTAGEFSHGILAQSIGGTGGSSGSSGNLIFALGGTSDDGGSGGTVDVFNYGEITTTGDGSRGVFAQSIGGGGGSGGTVFGVVALGGSGSYGGNAGLVTVKNFDGGSIVTTGVRSDGIFAQSVGGSGGSGSNSGGLFSLGGSGSRGGSGGSVVVENFGGISTRELGARGIVAQSIGGGGGDGGNSAGLVSVGGSGSGGGTGALVSVLNGGSITTVGDEATGIIAQSIGGGGGNGGSSGSVSVFAGVAVGGSGGTGGEGGNVLVTLQGTSDGNASLIRTEGDRATALFAQSVGGGGGNGGGAMSVTAGFGAAASVAVGGSGGAGGDGGVVTLARDTGYSVIETGGHDSSGIFLQSVGGGGGNGGYAIAIAASGGPASGSLAVAIGGNGGSGGTGGEVQVGNFANDGTLLETGFEGSILTRGDRSTGFFAQSVGGGGGNGGLAVAGSVSGGAAVGGSISIGLGGNGAGGGDGGLVRVGTEGNITTQGDHATGMLVQSVGGGGGNGGGSIAASLAFGGGAAGSIGVALGGNAADGGDGGNVLVTTRGGTTTTSGMNATGLLIQSVGGGGGNGGYSVAAGAAGAGVGAAAVNVALGGHGGGGGDGGDVVADLQTDVVTSSVLNPATIDPLTGETIPEHYSANSTGILVQSVGGGGGNGGFSIATGGAAAGEGAGAVSVGLGGSGATGGTGGTVRVTSSGNIETRGDRSSGLVAQSIGGGGGNGGYNITVAGAGAGTGSGGVSVGLGGSGGSGNNGGEVTLHFLGERITTAGDDSIGFLAQSVGGGGGNGGFTISSVLSGAGSGSGAISIGLGGSGGGGGDAGAVIASTSGDIWTRGERATGIMAQSLGGGGGNGGFSVTVPAAAAGTGSGSFGIGIGGRGALGGRGGDVELTVNSQVLTEGRDAIGILAQSVGGGGGNGGFSITAPLAGAGTGSASVGVGIGGAGGGGGDGGGVVTEVVGSVETRESGSGGILAQSVGGGGGNGGMAITGALAYGGTGSGAITLGLGGSGGSGGDGGTVDSRFTGDVFTAGNDSFGVAAQSIGGGGGNGGFTVTGAIGLAGSGSGTVAMGIGGSGGGGGDSARVDNFLDGYVQTTGERAVGFLTQSVGGGGGNGGVNVSGAITAAGKSSVAMAFGIGGSGGTGGDGGIAMSELIGGVVTTGDYSDAVLTQSIGGGGGNGGLNVSGALSLTKQTGGALAFGLGGMGSLGGEASDVTSTVRTTVARPQIGTIGDYSSAVVAQSLGGGGGNGGINVSGAASFSGEDGAAIGIGVGGFGGGGGNAGTVTMDVIGEIVTMGDYSHGLLAQSIGGGGGNGGMNIAGTLALTNSSGGGNTTAAASIGVGGFGGNAGNAGAVDLSFEGSVIARTGLYLPASTDPITGDPIPASFTPGDGAGSHGIAAQSIGGGGGNGGVNVSAGISYARSDGDGYGLVFGIGGFGGDGGDGETVDVFVGGGGNIVSYGAGHSAILAQSLGGGGGSGGMNVSGGITSDSPVIVGVGGWGGDAGTASAVTVTSRADLFASALDSKQFTSAGILAQSIGGGGGNGGLNVSGGLAIDKAANVPSLTLGVGGGGGSGATSGRVSVDHGGNVATSGDWIHGIMAQSIGGGGGNGALNVAGQINFADAQSSGGKKDLTIVAGVGGSGGEGANAGDVEVIHNGMIATQGDHARGVVAQSIGGGGGTGGLNVTGLFAQNSSPVNVGVGGTGGSGGDAGSVSIFRGDSTQSTGIVSTDGEGAHAIEASSIGGGGGDAGMNFNLAFTRMGANETSPGFAANFAIGGGGGDAGEAGTATVHNYSAIETLKDGSHGILAQSIGGGGGNATFNIAVAYAGGQNDPFNDRDGELLYQEPNKNMGFAFALGGATGDGGAGSDVEVLHVGDIDTYGKNSIGILAQSIGGGGGNAGLDIAYIKADGGKAGITIGRVGGTGGEGGTVALSSNGRVETRGERSHGLLAQSVGNGGGNSSTTTVSAEVPSNESPTGETRPISATVSVGLEGGQGGRGGDVSLTAEGAVLTHGENAHALFAQSVGGGGGNGGDAKTLGITAATFGLALGAEGGEGGIGGNVDVSNFAQLRTYADGSIGILAQSVGGGGGTGGMATGGGFKSGHTGLSIAIGGKGGKGMTGGRVTAANSGVIITDGVGSHGILAQSLGGGGGIGASAINMIVKNSVESATRVAVTVGGDGGEGARGGDVEVTNSGGIGTTQGQSVGILAQSIGGGGGNASKVVTNGITGTSGNHISATLGGSGGTGAEGGTVTVRNLTSSDPNSGKIITVGNESHGIMAMSIGGGGGNGSTTVTSIRSGSGVGSTAGSYSFTLGGSGGDGGRGGAVAVENDGLVQTFGYRAHGIIAQSIGGGGGNGGMSLAGDLALGSKTTPASGNVGMISLGGFGGDGNTAGNVEVTNRGAIEVFGAKSYGIFAQSVGGGGGDGAFAMALSRNLLKNPGTDLLASMSTLAMGGLGGSGADSGDVTVDHAGSIISHGDHSYGIFAQSVGGGGGNASSSLSAPAWTAADFALKQIVGGGLGGSAGLVTIRSTGTIEMLGANSIAQFGQSVNGGGGNVELFLDVSEQAAAYGDIGEILPNPGGEYDKVQAFLRSGLQLGGDLVDSAAGGIVDATHVGDLYVAGKGSVASYFQSIGGGGGRASQEIVVDSEADVDLELVLGGTVGIDSHGGEITLDRVGDIFAAGGMSRGISIQSIGGGGGDLLLELRRVADGSSGGSVAGSGGSAGPTPPPFSFFAIAAAPPAPATTIEAGGDGGGKSNGGGLNLNFTGEVTTSGDHAPAVIHQSIGGGGGQFLLSGIANLHADMGGINGAAGDGGDIQFFNVGGIHSSGTLAPGVVIQSIGGGGGAIFTDTDPDQISVGLRSSNSGNGGNIHFTQQGDVGARGIRSTGIILQSLGGGGGLVIDQFLGSAGGTGTSGAIRFELDGHLIADGAGGVGIFAQSRGSLGQGNIDIQLSGGHSLVFGTGGSGVHFSGGSANSLLSDQTIVGLGGIEGWAIRGEEGGEFIDNRGTVVGQVNLGGGRNAIVNQRNAFWLSGSNLLLGSSANMFDNRGQIHPGGSGLAQRTRMTGSFSQDTGGTTFSELDFGSGVLDGIDLTGTASLLGKVDVSLLNPQLVPSGSHETLLFSASGGISARQLELVTAPSVVISYGIRYPNPNDAVLAYNVDFSPEGRLGINLREVGDYFNRIQAAGSSPELAATVTRLLYTPEMNEYRFLLSQLGPDFYGELQAEMIRGKQRFGEALLGRGGHRFEQKGRVLWFDYDTSDTLHHRYDDYKAVAHRSNAVAMGFEFDWNGLTTGGAFSRSDQASWGYGGQWAGEGHSENIGWVLKHNSGGTEIAGTVSYGWNSMDVTRLGQVTNPFLAGAERDLGALTAMVRISHEFSSEEHYWKPVVDVGLTRLHARSAEESGGGATGLLLGAYDETHAWVRPGVELGREFALGGNARLRLHAEAGYLHYFAGDETSVAARFQGAPAGVSPMEVPIDLGSMASYGIGSTLILAEDARISVIYTRGEAQNYEFDALNLRFSTSF